MGKSIAAKVAFLAAVVVVLLPTTVLRPVWNWSFTGMLWVIPATGMVMLVKAMRGSDMRL